MFKIILLYLLCTCCFIIWRNM